MRQSVFLGVLCATVLLSGCAQTKRIQDTRSISFQELADAVEGHQVKLRLLRGKARTVHLLAVRPDSMVFTRKDNRPQSVASHEVVYIAVKPFPTRTLVGGSLGVLAGVGLNHAINASVECVTDACTIESLSASYLKLLAIPSVVLTGLVVGLSSDRHREKRRYMFEAGPGDPIQIVVYTYE